MVQAIYKCENRGLQPKKFKGFSKEQLVHCLFNNIFSGNV